MHNNTTNQVIKNDVKKRKLKQLWREQSKKIQIETKREKIPIQKFNVIKQIWDLNENG